MQIAINDDVDLKQWNHILKTNPFSSPFQSYDLYQIFRQTPGYDADVFAIADNQKIHSLIVITIHKESGIKGYFSRRGIVYGGPLIDSDNKSSFEHLLKEIIKYYKKKLIFIETRNSFDYSDIKPIFNRAGWNYIPYLNFHLSCNDQEAVWKNLNRKRRREINIAKNAGVELLVASTTDELSELYAIIENNYKNIIRKPILPYSLFKKLFESSLCTITIVKYEGKIIGGVICVLVSQNALYLWFGSALTQEYKKLYPLVMSIFGAIQYGYQNQFEYIDFMGAGQPGVKYGVRDFKAEFGGDLVEHGRFRHLLNPYLFTVGSIGLRLLSKLK